MTLANPGLPAAGDMPGPPAADIVTHMRAGVSCCWLAVLLAAAGPVGNNALPRQQRHRAPTAAPPGEGSPSELNVRQFGGAHGDGVTPDDVAIQKTINAAAAAAHSNGTIPAVYFPRGVYLLTKTLQVGSEPIRLTGDGRQASHLVAGEGLRGAPMLQYGTPAGLVEDGEVSALDFDAQGIALHCITAYARHSRFTALLLRKSTGSLVRSESGVGNTFVSSHYECGASSSDRTGVCLQSFASDGVHVAENTYVDFTTAVVLASAANVRIEGNEFTGLTPTNRSKTPTLVLSSIMGLTISGNLFETGGSPTGEKPGAEKSLYGCSDILLSGASAGNASNPCRGVSISTNVFNPAGYEHICAPYSAIMLAAAVRVSVVDNTNAVAYDGFNLLGTGADSRFYSADIHVQGDAVVHTYVDGSQTPRAPMIFIRPPPMPAPPGVHAYGTADGRTPSLKCDPKANPPEMCPGGILCPKCGERGAPVSHTST